MKVSQYMSHKISFSCSQIGNNASRRWVTFREKLHGSAFFHPVSLREANGLIEKPLSFIFEAFETVFQMSLTH